MQAKRYCCCLSKRIVSSCLAASLFCRIARLTCASPGALGSHLSLLSRGMRVTGCSGVAQATSYQLKRRLAGGFKAFPETPGRDGGPLVSLSENAAATIRT